MPRLLTETESVFEHRHLVAAVAATFVGTGFGGERVVSEVDRLVKSGAVVPIGRERNWPHPIYSTPEVIALERDLLRVSRTLNAQEVRYGPDQTRVAELARRAGLNSEQTGAARHAAKAAGLAIIEGAPGVGKTTLLGPVTQSWREAGWQVLGAASAWKVAHLLRDELSIEARAIDSWLAIVAAWSAARREQPDLPVPLLIAKTNRQVLLLNAGVREALRNEGALPAEDATTLAAVTPSGHEYRLGLSVGDRVRFLNRVDHVGVINGTEATLTRVEHGTDGSDGTSVQLTVRLGDREATFSPSDIADAQGRVRLGHAYASTVYGAQGLTTETALVWVDAAMDRHDIFVAASRARGNTRLFIDQASVKEKVRAERPLAEQRRPIDANELRTTLARALSRSGEKTSTLDYDVTGGATPELLAALAAPIGPDQSNHVARQPARRRAQRRSRGIERDV